ncbi:MAG: class I SAM-dependent methyltransferase [Rhodospirillaceae bacterium]|nr:class I SAM-dependent methyltransferase [Rhodospirillaceae bacterium]
MSDPLIEQYEAYPYPARDPADEAKRLIEGSPSHLLEIDHYLFAGRRDFRRPFRALIAGGGTGDGLIMLAQHLADRGCPAELVYLDLSTASRAIAEARARQRGFGNIQFLSGSLLDLPQRGLGRFDYIDCCGVLHHLEDPALGLAALRDALNPGGGMGIMVYGLHGRTGVYQAQAMLRQLTAGDPAPAATPQARLKVARGLMAQMPATNWLRRNPAVGDHLAAGDAGLYDLLLHSRDRAYDVAGLAQLVDGAGLEIAAFIEPWRYDPASYLTDADLLRRVARLDPIAQAGFAELLAGNLKRHIVYLVAKGRAVESVARPDDTELVPVLRAGSDSWTRNLGTARVLKAKIDGIEVAFPLPALTASILSRIDGKRSIAEIQRDLAETRDGPRDPHAFQTAFGGVYRVFNKLNRLFLSSTTA